MPGIDIYEQLKAAGAEMSHHESDLYVKVTPQSTEILKGYYFKSNVTTFKSIIDKFLWYEVPFAYTPFWDDKQKSNPRFRLYAKSLGKDPQDLIQENIANGTHMLGFTLWNSNKTFQFKKEHPETCMLAYDKHANILDWKAYDKWLEINYKEEQDASNSQG